MFKKLMAEMLGTFWLVFGGSAVLSAAYPELGIGVIYPTFLSPNATSTID